MRNALALLLLVLCMTTVRAEAADGDTSAPLTPMEHLMSVNAMVNGKGPFRFVIDSGAAGKLRVSPELAKELALEQVGEALAGDPSGANMTKRPLVRVGSIEVAGLRFNDVDAAVGAGRRGPVQPDGVIGLALFGQRTVTIDYPKKELRITTRTLPADLPHVVPFTLRQGIPAIDIDAAGVTIHADVDLGSPAMLSVPPSIALPFNGEPQIAGHGRTSTNEFDIKRGDLRGDLRVAGFTEANASVDIVDIFPVANIGSRFLRQYAVTFDLASSRLMLARGGAGPQRVMIGGGGPDESKEWPQPELRAGLTPQQTAHAIAAYAQKLSDTDHFSGVVFAAKGDRVLLERAWGLADVASKTPNSVDTKFNIGSINKVFTQTAIAQLATAGKLSLDDTIRKHLPDYPSPVADKITIRQLLEHKSGLGDFFGPKYIAAPPSSLRELSDFLPLFVSAPLQFEPGTSQRYSNAGYVVLGLIIEHATGEKYRDYVQKHIFEPAGMKDSGFWAVDERVAKRATGYTKRGPDGPIPAREPNTKTLPGRPSSAGGAYSTARDLFRLFQWKKANGVGVGGGAPGLNASVEIDDGWTVIAMSNYDPPSAEALTRGAMAIVRGRDEG
jgi:CubicO group peptidase (beta-lactamase class C family)